MAHFVVVVVLSVLEELPRARRRRQRRRRALSGRVLERLRILAQLAVRLARDHSITQLRVDDQDHVVSFRNQKYSHTYI